MKKIGGVILILFALLFLSTAAAFAQQSSASSRDPVFEQQVYDRLAKINPDAVLVFKDATTAWDAQDFATAKAGFVKVLELAPGFPDALRRLSSVELAQEDYQNAEIHARQALAVDPNPINQAAVAAALTGFDDTTKLTESLSLAQAAQQSQPDDIYFNYILLLAAAKNKNMGAMRLASDQLIKIAPDLAPGHYYAGIIAYADKNPMRAESELLLAEQYGYPKDTIDKIISDYNIHTQSVIQLGLVWSGIGLAGWLVGLLLLLLVGWVLSSVTLRAVNRQLAGSTPLAQPAELSIRGLYRVVISIAAGYFYFSIPFLIILVVALVGGIIYLFFAIGTIPIYLALFIVCAGLVTIYALIRSIFAHSSKGNPGRKVEQNEMPELWQLTREVAARVGTLPVDSIFLTPGVEMGVLQRGSLIHQLQDRGERALILGIGSLNNLSQGQFRAILAHEYGHFTNRDTDSSTITRQVQISVHNMAVTLAANGIARWYNPVWWFITGYYRIFMRITLGASRLQEMLADRVAAMSYGTRALTSGLQTFIRTSLEFNLKVNAEVKEAKAVGRSLNNLYSLPNLLDPGPLEKKLAEVMAHPPSPYDSHPAPRQRLTLIERIPAGGYFDDGPRPAWDLIPNASQIQEEATSQIEAQIRR